VVRDEVHPSVIQLGGEVASILGIKLAGIDILAPTLATPLEQSGGIIGEINTTPGLHHHYLVSDKSKATPVAQIILDYIFANVSKHQPLKLASA
jgi:cyanophycin synthetase